MKNLMCVCGMIIVMLLALVLPTDAGNLDGFFNRGMGLAGGVGRQTTVSPLGVAVKIRGPLAGSQQGAERGTGSRVLNDAAAG